MPVCAPGSLPGFVDTVSTVGRPRVTRRVGGSPPSEIPYLVDSPPPRRVLALVPCIAPLELPQHTQVGGGSSYLGAENLRMSKPRL
jgi:hypothetical protein